MTSKMIFEHMDEDDETRTRIMDRKAYLKLSVNGPTSFTFMDPADVVRMRDALSAAIERNGWTA